MKILKHTLLLVMFAAVPAVAASYKYVKAEQFRQWSEGGKKTIIVDIQVPAEFARRHLKGSLETGAYPVEKEEERKRLDKTLETISASTEDIVVVCPRGGGGAKRTVDYLKSKGVAEKRIFILEKGMEGWPYGKEMCNTAG